MESKNLKYIFLMHDGKINLKNDQSCEISKC